MINDLIYTALRSLTPIVRRRTYWRTSADADVDLAWNGLKPREIRVHVGGSLQVVYDDGTGETIPNIPSGAIFADSCWARLVKEQSTATVISVGW